MKDHTLSLKERERYNIVCLCIAGEIINAVAAARLGMTVRQIQKLKASVREKGERGILHGNRLCTPWNATPKNTNQSVVTFLKKKDHRDFGPTFAAEQLAKQESIMLSRETVRMIMVNADLWKSKKRSGPAIHRQWRERKALYGELIQFDGSYHRWFENGEEHCLLGAIDDATSTVTGAVFEDNEGVYAVFRFWWSYIERHGRPVAVYLDKFSTYKVNHANAVDNKELMTQFERAMDELDITVITAHSPEAKGRVERLFGTLQDRMVKEMRLEGIKDRTSANRFLKETYIPEHNERFSVPARTEGDAHRLLGNDLRLRLSSIFSIQSERRVNNDFTIRFKSRWFQLDETQPTTVYKGDVVTLEERLDGTVHIRLKGNYLAYVETPQRPQAARMQVTALTRKKQAWKPSTSHPWRRYGKN